MKEEEAMGRMALCNERGITDLFGGGRKKEGRSLVVGSSRSGPGSAHDGRQTGNPLWHLKGDLPSHLRPLFLSLFFFLFTRAFTIMQCELFLSFR